MVDRLDPALDEAIALFRHRQGEATEPRGAFTMDASALLALRRRELFPTNRPTRSGSTATTPRSVA